MPGLLLRTPLAPIHVGERLEQQLSTAAMALLARDPEDRWALMLLLLPKSSGRGLAEVDLGAVADELLSHRPVPIRGGVPKRGVLVIGLEDKIEAIRIREARVVQELQHRRARVRFGAMAQDSSERSKVTLLEPQLVLLGIA